MKTAFTFKVKEEFNSFDDIKLIEEEKVEELEQNREINNDDLVVVDNQETDKNQITSKDGDSLEKEPRMMHFADDVDSQFLARRLLYKATEDSVLYCTRVAECQIIYT